MDLFHNILKTAVAGGASDVHLKIGTPVVFRINRELLAIESPSPTEQWMNEVVENVAPAHLKSRLERERGIDFSYFVPDIGRFRTNLFQQRGHWCLAMRYVKTVVPKFEELGLLEQPTVKKLIEENRSDKLAAAIETGTEEGMISFNQALYNLVKQGKVSEHEALSKATNPQALEMNLKGIFLDEGRRILS